MDFLILALMGSMHITALVLQPVQFFLLLLIQILIVLITQYLNHLYIIQLCKFHLMPMVHI